MDSGKPLHTHGRNRAISGRHHPRNPTLTGSGRSLNHLNRLNHSGHSGHSGHSSHLNPVGRGSHRKPNGPGHRRLGCTHQLVLP